jgi:hypothetical protein
MADDDDHLEQLRKDLDTWVLDQELDVAAEVYDPKRKNIHELEGEDMLDRFRTLLGFDVSWDAPPPDPTEEPGGPT